MSFQRLNANMLEKGLLKTCMENIQPNANNKTCPICKQPIMEFLNPLTGKIEPEIKCQCEQHFLMLNDFYQVNSKIHHEDLALYRAGRKIDYYKAQQCELILKAEQEIKKLKKIILDNQAMKISKMAGSAL
jgi:hypothetical protein